MMRKCKITVLKKTFFPELAEEYGAEGIGPCRITEEGQSWITDFYRMPAGFCEEAWIAIRHYAFAICHGGAKELFFNDNWVRVPETAICSCNDGLRPVVFKIEPATPEESQTS